METETVKRPKAVVLTDVWTGERHVVDLRPRPLMQTETWTTAAGETLTLGEMERTHIERVIAFLRRRARALHWRAVGEMIADLSGPLGPRGDWAQDTADREFDALAGTEPTEWIETVPIVRALKDELIRRYEPWGVAA